MLSCILFGSSCTSGPTIIFSFNFPGKTYRALARAGKRVLAVATRTLPQTPSPVKPCYIFTGQLLPSTKPHMPALTCPPLHHSVAQVEASKMIRGEVEKDLTFQAFLVLSTPLKPDTVVNIKRLVESSHHITMITGTDPF